MIVDARYFIGKYTCEIGKAPVDDERMEPGTSITSRSRFNPLDFVGTENQPFGPRHRNVGGEHVGVILGDEGRRGEERADCHPSY